LDGTLRTVDVVIPVFRDVGRTQACIEAVLNSVNETQLHVVVINDASPEAGLTQWLRDRADSAGFELIEHVDNRGFVASANEGLRLHPDRDVVLLNSDTEVANDWLDRLCACADLDPRTATATPFSNNATICSFPVPNVANPLPVGWTVARLDALFARVNAGQSREIPTGVGFCLFLRRSCLDDIGFFDEQHFGRGYGEENDFCLRAANRGWVNRLCGDVFVYHAGGASFGAQGSDLREKASAVMDALHPDYQGVVREFVRLDPLAPLRERVSAEILLQSLADTAAAGRCVLHVLGLGGGGSALNVRQLAGMDASEGSPGHLILFLGEQTAFLQDLRSGLYYPLHGVEALRTGVATLVYALGIVTIHWHVVNDAAMALSEALSGIGCRQVVTLHDVGFASLTAFSDQQAASDEQGDEAWRRRVTRFLERAAAVLAPSQFVAELCAEVTGKAIEARVIPHPGPPGRQVSAVIDGAQIARRCREAGFRPGEPVVGLVGALGEHKGAAHWRRMREVALEQGRRVNWVLIGYADPELTPSVQERCVIHGAYLPEELGALLDGYGVDLVYFPPGMPESFSYALSDAWLAGWPVVVHDRGALGERLREHPEGGWILSSTLEPEPTLAALQGLLEDSAAVARARDAVRGAAPGWLERPEYISSIMKEVWMTNTQAAPVDAGRVLELQGLLRTHLDDGAFRPELIRLSGENSELRRQLAESQDAVQTLSELAGQRERWADRLERDIARLKAEAGQRAGALEQEVATLADLAERRGRWAEKLERDVASLADLVASLADLAEQRERWAGKLEQDIVALRELADRREQWANKLETDIAVLVEEKQALASALESLRQTMCIRATEWLRRQRARVWT
jgi:O-antigen biosynthesis protein